MPAAVREEIESHFELQVADLVAEGWARRRRERKQRAGSAIGGVAGALAATRLLRASLYGVSATDPVTFAAVVVVLSLAALGSCWLPARRAARLDPVRALRVE